MTNEIQQAVLDEMQLFLNSLTDDKYSGGTCVFKTDWQPDATANQMPLVLLDMIDAPESSQYLGGVTRMDWAFAINAYSTMPDAYLDSIADPYATDLQKFIDLVRRHFTTAQEYSTWLSAGMPEITNTYGFKFTLSGTQKADALAFKTGFIKGWRLLFDSVALDTETTFIPISASVLENVKQVGSTETNELFTPWAQTINIPLVESTTYTVPANSFIPSMALQTVNGTPFLEIIAQPGDITVMADSQPGIFQLITPQLYCEEETTLYFNQTGAGIINTRVDVIRNYLPKLIAT